MLKIEIKDVPRKFIISKLGNTIKLKIGRSKPIELNLPFFLDEDIAKISAMIMDGCIAKNLSSCSFSQKKDKNKVKEFEEIIKKKFNITGRYFIGDNGAPCIVFSNKTLCSFLYYCVDIYKSGESARIPKWIWNSPVNVIKTYIRYAFAMEGSVSDFTKGKKEIRFHSVDKSYLLELRELLKNKFSINSSIYEYFAKGYGRKYYLTMTNKDDICKFREIGIELKTHQNRLDKIVESYKNKAWEVTLVSLLNFKNKKFHIKDVNILFPYLHKRSIHARLTDLVKFGYLKFNDGYYLTKLGLNKGTELLPSIKLTRIYTNPRDNENLVVLFLKNHTASISQIARELNINVSTVRDTLRRLEKKHKVKLLGTDKFQRKIWGEGR